MCVCILTDRIDNLLTPDEHLGTQLVSNLYDEYTVDI